MADVFGTGQRGCFHLLSSDATAGMGAQLQMPSSTLPAALADPFLVTSFSMVRKESIAHNKTFGGGIYSYAFGNDPNSGILEVGFTAFLGTQYGVSPMTTLLDAYAAGRVSNSLETASFEIGGAAVAGYVVGITSGTQDAQLRLQQFTIRLSLPEV